jgi:hypothetical protein
MEGTGHIFSEQFSQMINLFCRHRGGFALGAYESDHSWRLQNP